MLPDLGYVDCRTLSEAWRYPFPGMNLRGTPKPREGGVYPSVQRLCPLSIAGRVRRNGLAAAAIIEGSLTR